MLPLPDDMRTGSLVVVAGGDSVYFEGKWRSSQRTQVKRRLGRAWLEKNSAGEWIPRAGRIRPGYLDAGRAQVKLAKLIEEHEVELGGRPRDPAASFDAAAAAWLDHLQHEKRAKPNTLKEARIILAKPSSPKQKGGRIMRTFSGRKLADISSPDIQIFLAMLDRQGLSARNTNRHRQTLHSIFNYAMRPDTFGLKANPVAATSKRRKPAPSSWMFSSRLRLRRSRWRLVLGSIGASREGRCQTQRRRSGGGPTIRMPTSTSSRLRPGLRQAELAALRWKYVETDQVNVSRAMSAGVETTTKSRQVRVVALSDPAKAAFERIRERENFTSREDHVFCTAAGAPLDRANVRKRFVKAQEAAGVHVRTFHDLRHSFGSMAVRVFDPITVQRLMGHADLQTTARYLHSRAREGEGAKLTAAFQ